MAKGIVVDHKDSGVRYAISEHNFNPKVHKRVRDLQPGETVLGYSPRRKESPADDGYIGTDKAAANDPSDDLATLEETSDTHHPTKHKNHTNK